MSFKKIVVEKINPAGLSAARKQAAFISDTYAEQLEELFLARNPKYRFEKNYQAELGAFIKEHLVGGEIDQVGNWLYFEWRKTLVHLLPDELFQELRTARNRQLITAAEQAKIYSTTIAISGLSMGSHVAVSTALSGIGNKFKIADFDGISVSNLNRIIAGVTQAGQKKSDWAAHLILEINPYAEVYIYEQGITEQNIADFITGSAGSPPADLLVEELDNLKMKVLLRQQASQSRIPVVMVTDTENTVVDIERYDQQPQPEVFNGLAGNPEELANVQPGEMVKKVATIIGPESFSSREQQSMLGVGKEIYSWPQLGAQAEIAGGLAAYLVRKILLGADIRNGKYNFNIDGLLDWGYNDPAATRARAAQTEKFKKELGL